MPSTACLHFMIMPVVLLHCGYFPSLLAMLKHCTVANR